MLRGHREGAEKANDVTRLSAKTVSLTEKRKMRVGEARIWREKA
jgi:hypothetical protein